MVISRPATQRGHADHGWLRTWHSFSFADYYDPRHMGFGNLRVINEDWIAPGAGFPTHGHRDMEIVTYVLDGALAHRDSLGNGTRIPPGDVQRMSAGTGVQHSEYNAAPAQDTHLLQIWILPERPGIAPGYEQKTFSAEDKRGRLRLVAAPPAEAAAAEAVTLHADARLYAGLFDGDEAATLTLAPGRLGYVHLARGAITVNGHRLNAGDALKLVDEPAVEVHDGDGAEVLVFDLAR